MKVKGHFKKQTLIMFLDSESTHKFIDPRVERDANCYIHPIKNFEFMINNDGKITCKGMCHNVKLNMGNYTLKNDTYALNLGGCDIVLRAQWLQILGPTLWDFVELWIQFIVKGK